MSDQPVQMTAAAAPERKHPPINSIEDVIMFKLARFVTVNDRAGHRWSEQYFKLSINEWRLLALTQAYAPVRAGDLADLMFMDKSQLSRLIKALTAASLIKSKKDPEDARAVVLSLTSRGKLMYEEVMGEVSRRVERVLAPLDVDEVQVFNNLLDRLIAHNMTLLSKPMAK